jgi:hypothetical protein
MSEMVSQIPIRELKAVHSGFAHLDTLVLFQLYLTSHIVHRLRRYLSLLINTADSTQTTVPHLRSIQLGSSRIKIQNPQNSFSDPANHDHNLLITMASPS